jgi:hypothetical protein
VVRIENTRTSKSQDIVVEQRGYPYTIEIEDNAVELSNFEAYGKRYFDVRVRSNVDFEIDFPDNAGWLTNDSYRLTLDRGARPREVTVRFNWDINTSPRERLAEVAFRPKSGVTMARQDALNVRQEASAPIVENTREGDSVALLSIARAMGLYTMWDASTPMSTWNNVTLWEEQMAGCTPDKVGRVRKVEIMLFHTREKLPYEVRYLTAAEEIYKNYSRQRQFFSFLEQSGAQPPVRALGNPELYVLCKKGGDTLAVALFNCFADAIDGLDLTLSEDWREATCYRASGELFNAQTLHIHHLSAFDWCFVLLKK